MSVDLSVAIDVATFSEVEQILEDAEQIAASGARG